MKPSEVLIENVVLEEAYFTPASKEGIEHIANVVKERTSVDLSYEQVLEIIEKFYRNSKFGTGEGEWLESDLQEALKQWTKDRA